MLWKHLYLQFCAHIKFVHDCVDHCAWITPDILKLIGNCKHAINRHNLTLDNKISEICILKKE